MGLCVLVSESYEGYITVIGVHVGYVPRRTAHSQLQMHTHVNGVVCATSK